MDRETVEVYEERAAEWNARRKPSRRAAARDFGRDAAAGDGGGPVVDLGCGPGWYTGELGEPAIALDAARAMLDLVPSSAPKAWRIQSDLARLPFRTGSVRAAWASHSYVHVARSAIPLALHDLHRVLRVGGPADVRVFAGDEEHGTLDHDDFPGRRFSLWPPAQWRDVLHGAGFIIDGFERTDPSGSYPHGPAGEASRATPRQEVRLAARLTRARTLADTVGPRMRLLVCGLNPSVYAADAGIGFARPGNRFWPAAVGAGLVRRPHDPVRALLDDGVGMTDLVKRATARAEELEAEEYQDGIGRIDRLAAWLEPAAVCFVGLAGWRLSVDRRARPGPQSTTIGGRPVYVMPNTSGINSRSSLADLVGHLRAAQALARSAG